MNKQTLIRDINGNMVNAADVPSMPSRAWRDAWKVDGTAISVDMTAARALFRRRAAAALEERRASNILPLFLDASLNNDAAALTALKQSLNASKLLPTLPAIDNAASLAELSALWDQHVDKLGPNPFL